VETNIVTDQGFVWLCGSRSKSVGAGFSLRSIGCTPALHVTQKQRCSCGKWHVALYVLYAFAFD